MSPAGWVSLARCVPGILAFAWSCSGNSLLAGMGLVAAVWADGIAAWCLRRCGLAATSSSVQADGFVDCLCFIAAPAAFAMSLTTTPALIPVLAAFVLAGIFRLTRFQQEGLIQGGYRGLPVTYNGYIFPAAAALQFHLLMLPSAVVWCVIPLLSAALMVSTFIVPEI